MAEAAKSAEAMQQEVLWIDTCGAPACIALFRAGVLAAERLLPDRTASAHLVTAVRELLVNGRPASVVVVSGPGSFTGVRVGLSAAKALCEVWGAPLFVVSRLALLGGGMTQGFAVIDAGRGELYVRDLATGHESLETFTEVLEQAAEASLPLIAEPALAARMPNALAREISSMAAWPLIELALSHKAVDVALVDANYVRGEAEIYAKKAVTA